MWVVWIFISLSDVKYWLCLERLFKWSVLTLWNMWCISPFFFSFSPGVWVVQLRRTRGRCAVPRQPGGAETANESCLPAVWLQQRRPGSARWSGRTGYHSQLPHGRMVSHPVEHIYLLCVQESRCWYFVFPISPFVLGNLWDVTDRDIDRFTKALLEAWFSAGSGAPLLSYMGSSRQATHLKHLIGAAPVVYGLPLHLE